MWSASQTVSQPGGQSARWSVSQVVSQPGGQSARWLASHFVSLPDGQPARWSASQVVSQPGGQSARWSASQVVSQPGGQSARWSVNQVVSQLSVSWLVSQMWFMCCNSKTIQDFIVYKIKQLTTIVIIINIHFEKVFDLLNWKFIAKCLEALSYWEKFILFIVTLIERLSLLLNNEENS